MTLREYIEDYASPHTRSLAEKIIAQQVEQIPTERVREITRRRLEEIINGKRDFRF